MLVDVVDRWVLPWIRCFEGFAEGFLVRDGLDACKICSLKSLHSGIIATTQLLHSTFFRVDRQIHQ
jgi:hypothetical protein